MGVVGVAGELGAGGGGPNERSSSERVSDPGAGPGAGADDAGDNEGSAARSERGTKSGALGTGAGGGFAAATLLTTFDTFTSVGLKSGVENDGTRDDGGALGAGAGGGARGVSVRPENESAPIARARSWRWRDRSWRSC